MVRLQMATSIERWSLNQLDPCAHNAGTHSGEQAAQIAAFIKQFGFVNPALFGFDEVIIAATRLDGSDQA